jgi:hypothetical protein
VTRQGLPALDVGVEVGPEILEHATVAAAAIASLELAAVLAPRGVGGQDVG